MAVIFGGLTHVCHHRLGSRADGGTDEEFGNAVAVVGDMVFIGASSVAIGNLTNRGEVSLFSLALPVLQLTVDAAFCAEHGVASFSGACIAAALDEADVKSGAIAVVALEPGRFDWLRS